MAYSNYLATIAVINKGLLNKKLLISIVVVSIKKLPKHFHCDRNFG